MTTTPDPLPPDAILRTMRAGLVQTDLTGVILYANPAFHALSGYPAGALTGMNLFALLGAAAQPLPEGTDFSDCRRRDGSALPVRIDWSHLQGVDGSPAGLLAVITDTSQQQALYERMRRERDLTRHYLDFTHFIMVVLDRDGRVIDVNRKACELLGYRRDELLGRDWLEHCTPPAWRETLRAVLQRLFNGEIAGLKENENPVLTASGEQHLVAWHNTTQHDDQGRVLSVIGSGEDITEASRARKEQEQLHEELRKAQKMEALGRLTSGIAHDFNNILASILGYADLALDVVSQRGEEELARYLREVIGEGEKARDLITQMLAFARNRPGERVALNPLPLIKELAKVAEASLPDHIALRVSGDEDLPKTHIDPAQLHQAVLNLCNNARDALEQQRDGHIDIGLNHVHCGQARCSACHQIFDGEYLEISVADDGEGIDPRLLEQVFEPFVTGRKDSRHRGMGLATVHGIVHEHGGHILVDSTRGYGTTVRLLLPLEMPETDAAPGRPTADRPGHDADILIVEDEECIARLQGEMLQSHGYRTEVYSDPYEALRYFKAQPQRFDCVVVDQAMPSLGGLEFARRVSHQRPELPIILCTNAEPVDKAELAQAGISGTLGKPFSSPQLLSLITRLLAGGEDSTQR